METLEIKNIYGVAQTPRGYAVALDVKAEKLQFDDKVRLYYRIFGDTRSNWILRSRKRMSGRASAPRFH